MFESNTENPHEPPPGLFFAGSDDEDEEPAAIPATSKSNSPSLPQTPRTSSSHSSPPGQPLFLQGDEDEDDVSMTEGFKSQSPVSRKRQAPIDYSDVEVDRDGPSRSTLKTEDSDSIICLSDSSSEIQLKKNMNLPPPPKKRRVSPVQSSNEPDDMFQPTYVGEILVPNAWSNVSGKGYVKVNDSICIQREEFEEVKPGPSSSKIKQDPKKANGKKQITLSSMLKSQPIKANKRKSSDNIVRLVNNKGFGEYYYLILPLDVFIYHSQEFGRLPTEISWWISKLLEQGIMLNA